MDKKNLGENTICTHIGEIEDKQFKGAVSPMYLSTAYEFMDVDMQEAAHGRAPAVATGVARLNPDSFVFTYFPIITV